MNKPVQLQSLRVRNFKAIADSRTVKLTPLTVFIGHNGAGKSSLIEALETWQAIVCNGLDIAMQRWFGIEHARHKGQEAKGRLDPITFDLALGASPRKVSRVCMAVNSDPAANQMEIVDEHVTIPGQPYIKLKHNQKERTKGRSMLTTPDKNVSEIAQHIHDWQFLTLAPERMGVPVPQQRTGGGVRLARDGANIADFLLDLRRQDQNAYEGIVETMTYVLPYAKDLQPSLTSSEIERKTWLQLTEADFKVPGWMLSTGTLRLLALLALLRHPNPPPLIVVEEIENGLDPRSIHLIVEEIRNVVLDGTTQVLLTTHSPYLLDLLTLDHLVLVERNAKGLPIFHRTADNNSLIKWAEDFAPGRLYTMGSLTGDLS